MDYYKYIKYKNKYLDLKNNQQYKGGIGETRMTQLDYYILAGNIHKDIKKNIYHMIQPGTRIYDIFLQIRQLTKKHNAEIPFPPCISLSNIVAHYVPFSDDNTIIANGDMVKVDYGVSIDGHIVDSAFSVYYDPALKPLYDATKDSIDAAIKMFNVDIPLNEIGKTIQEIVESYEINYNGQLYPLKVIKTLKGHSIEKSKLHGATSILNYINTNTNRITPGTYAIEPLVSIMSDHHIPYKPTNSFTSYNGARNLSLEDNIMNNINEFKQDYSFISPYKNDMVAHMEHSLYVDNDIKHILTE